MLNFSRNYLLDITHTVEHRYVANMTIHEPDRSAITSILEWYPNGAYKKITLYTDGKIFLENTYNATHSPKDFKQYWPNGKLAQHITYNTEQQITYYREYYKSGNLFANSNSFTSDNTPKAGRIYYDGSNPNVSTMVWLTSAGDYFCYPHISANFQTCTPDEISFFDRTFDKLR